MSMRCGRTIPILTILLVFGALGRCGAGIGEEEGMDNCQLILKEAVMRAIVEIPGLRGP